MSAKFLTIIAFLFGSLSVWAEARIERPILFALEKDGQTSYILGTFHMGINLSELPAWVLTKLNSRAVFMSEAGLLDEQEGPSPSYDQAPAILPGTVTKLQARGVPSPYLKLLETKPGLGCFMYLYIEWMTENTHIETFDHQIFEYAKRQHKTLIDLDDPSVNEVSQELSLCDVNALADNVTPEQARDNFAQDRQKFRQGIMTEDLSQGSDDLLEVSHRNAKWLGKIAKAHAAGAFIIMGGAHLVGENSVLKGLQKKGFKIDRIDR